MSCSQVGNIMFPPWEHLAQATSYSSLFTFHFSLLTSHFSLLTFHFSLLTFHFSLLTLHFSLAKRKIPHLSRHMPKTPLYKGVSPFSSPPSSLPSSLPFLSRHLSHRFTPKGWMTTSSQTSERIRLLGGSIRGDGRDKGEIWEGYGRDKNNLSHAETPIYKGISSDDGRDGDVFALFTLTYTILIFLSNYLELYGLFLIFAIKYRLIVIT